VPAGSTATYSFGALDLVDLPAASHAISGANGCVSLGLYASFDAAVHPRSQTPAEPVIYTGSTSTGSRVQAVRCPATDTYTSAGTYISDSTTIFVQAPLALSSGTYSVVVANNVDDQTLAVAATATIQLSR